jgi:hypothetical protein
MRVEKREFAWEFSQLSCPGQIKWEQELHESWEARVCVRVFSTFMPRSNENKSCMRVDENWLDITTHVAKPLINIWTSSKLMRVDENWRSNTKENGNSYQLSSIPIFNWRPCFERSYQSKNKTIRDIFLPKPCMAWDGKRGEGTKSTNRRNLLNIILWTSKRYSMTPLSDCH